MAHRGISDQLREGHIVFYERRGIVGAVEELLKVSLCARGVQILRDGF
jgi:hypothetical protein